MSSILPGYEYDVFISYRHKDNKYDGWVSEFIANLEKELEATFKENISIYFDTNPHDGLLENHQVDHTLAKKLKSLIFIPIISQTYCDPQSFAWQHEFLPFLDQSSRDAFGLNVELSNGNVANRILPVKIHDIDAADEKLLQEKLGSVIRSIDFIYQSPGVNRPLRTNDTDNSRNLNYRNQINKVANAIKGIVDGLKAIKKDAAQQVETERSIPIETGGLTEEITKRDLVKVGLVYIIASLILWKAIDLAVNLIGLSQQLSNVSAMVLAAFFPIAMFLAWRFEKAPTGFVRINSPAAKNNPFTARQKKPLTGNTTILGLVVLMLGLYFVPQRFQQAPASDGESNATSNKSIAVLYFDNMSADPGQDYMSDGLTEEIITRLTKIDGLRVISRTSVRVYKGQPLNLKKIAKDLNVNIVLEGSVRKAGNQLRVTAQLINAETDEHLWAESFDRELKDVFEVQTEIARIIADKFKISITPEINVKVSEISTRNTEAYDYYLKGRHIAFNQFYFIGDSMAFQSAKGLYEKAIQLDPEFALAYAGLADLYDAARFSDFYAPEMDSLRNRLSRKAYQLDPNSAFVNNVRIWMLANRSKPLMDSAFFHARKALQLDPNDYYNYSSMGALLSDPSYGVGLFEQAIPFYEKAVNLNPLDPSVHSILGACYSAVGNVKKANQEFQQAYELAPSTQYLGAGNTMFWLIDANRLDEAERMRESIISKYARVDYRNIEARLLIARGKKEEALKVMTDYKINSAFLFALLDNRKEAIAIMKQNEKSILNNYLRLRNLPVWATYQNDPEFQSILAKHKAKHEEYTRRYAQDIEDFIRKD